MKKMARRRRASELIGIGGAIFGLVGIIVGVIAVLVAIYK